MSACCSVAKQVVRNSTKTLNTQQLRTRVPQLHVPSRSLFTVFKHGCCDKIAQPRFLPKLVTFRYLSPIKVDVTTKWPTITGRSEAESIVKGLSDKEREILNDSLHAFRENLNLTDVDDVTTHQLLLVAFCNSIPFIGFGFLDNTIMIIAGDYIDLTIGISLGISTMAAAAMGNLIADVAGISVAGYIEILASKLKIMQLKLTPIQLARKSVKVAQYTGRGTGMIIGCIIGMFPLLFLRVRDDVTDSGCDKHHPD